MLDEWARKWNIPAVALHDLRVGMGLVQLPPAPGVDDSKLGSETRQQSLVRIDAAQQGVWLTRNNVGALLDQRGVPVRYGLANESKEQNKRIKSGDLIGIKSVLIGPQHLGMVFGQFVSREVKREGWTYSGDEHEQAQLRWANFVISKGGDAAFTTGRF